VTDALSRVEEVQTPMDYTVLAESQKDDEELKDYLHRESGLKLEKIQIPDTGVDVYCDTATPTPRPFLTKSFCRAAFSSVHSLVHPEIKATGRLVAQRYVWPSMKADGLERACPANDPRCLDKV